MSVCVCVCHNFTSIVSIYSASTRLRTRELYPGAGEVCSHFAWLYCCCCCFIVVLLLLLLPLLGVIICFGLLGSFTPEQKRRQKIKIKHTRNKRKTPKEATHAHRYESACAAAVWQGFSCVACPTCVALCRPVCLVCLFAHMCFNFCFVCCF